MSTLSVKSPSAAVSTLTLLVLAAVLISIAGFSEALLELVRRWNGQEEYSHGFLIPIVTAWLLWTRRDAIADSIGPPSLAGPVLIALAIVMNIVGELSAIFIISQVGFVIALMGIVLA